MVSRKKTLRMTLKCGASPIRNIEMLFSGTGAGLGLSVRNRELDFGHFISGKPFRCQGRDMEQVAAVRICIQKRSLVAGPDWADFSL